MAIKRSAESKATALSAKWPLVFFVLLIVSFLVHAGVRMWGSLFMVEWARIGYGALASVIMLILTSYSLRKIVFTRKMGSMEGWRKTHLYLGLFCVALIFMHTNFKVYGNFGLLMIILFSLVILSGMMGELMYKTIPVWLSKQGSDAMELDEKLKKPGEYLTTADEIAEKATNEFKVFYGQSIRSLFAKRIFPPKYLFMSQSDVIASRKKLFNHLASQGPPKDRMALSSLEALYAERDKVQFKYARLQVMRIWSNAHVPATAALLTAMLAHIWAVSYY